MYRFHHNLHKESSPAPLHSRDIINSTLSNLCLYQKFLGYLHGKYIVEATRPHSAVSFELCAAIVRVFIQRTCILTGAKYISFRSGSEINCNYISDTPTYASTPPRFGFKFFSMVLVQCAASIRRCICMPPNIAELIPLLGVRSKYMKLHIYNTQVGLSSHLFSTSKSVVFLCILANIRHRTKESFLDR